MFELVPLRPHPDDVDWPSTGWPAGDLRGVDAGPIEAAVGRLMAQPPELGLTLAVVVIHRGRLVLEAYGPDTTADTTLISWSMAKSVTHALVGLLALDGTIDVHSPAPVAAWAGDARSQITVQHLLNMRDGLDFAEDYVDAGSSDVIEMLFGAGATDHAAYAVARLLAHPPGDVWNYSSGTTNILARIVGDVAGDVAGGGSAGVSALIHGRLLGPLGMTSAEPKFDAAGTFVGSSYLYATARDFAKFGYLYLRDGLWDGCRILPAGWVDHARTWTATDPDNGFGYGAHWWLWADQRGSLACHGFEGQYIVVCPQKDVVLVRLGKSPAELGEAVVEELRCILNAFPDSGI